MTAWRRTAQTRTRNYGRRFWQRGITSTTGENGGASVVALEVEAVAVEQSVEGVETPPAAMPWDDPDALLYTMSENDRAVTLGQAQMGNDGALQCVLRTMLARPNKGAQMLDLAHQARQELIIATFGKRNDLARTNYLMKAEMVGLDLLREANPSPLEHLLIGRVVTCWLACELADIDACSQEEYHSPGMHADYYARRQDRAHKRFLQAVEALNRMRRYLSPMPFAAAHVNIAAPGGQQINQVNTQVNRLTDN